MYHSTTKVPNYKLIYAESCMQIFSPNTKTPKKILILISWKVQQSSFYLNKKSYPKFYQFLLIWLKIPKLLSKLIKLCFEFLLHAAFLILVVLQQCGQLCATVHHTSVNKRTHDTSFLAGKDFADLLGKTQVGHFEKLLTLYPWQQT